MAKLAVKNVKQQGQRKLTGSFPFMFWMTRRLQQNLRPVYEPYFSTLS